MSRNGPIGFAGLRAAAARRPAAEDPFGAQPAGQPAQQWPPQYADPQAAHQQSGYPQQAGYGQPGFPPQPGHGQPQQGHAQAQPQGQQGYYFPQTAAEPDPAYGQQGAGHQLPFESPAQAVPNFTQAGQHAQAPRWPQQQQPDARGYDLGNYMQPGAQYQQQPDALHHGDFDAPGSLQRPHDPSHLGYGETDADFDEILAEEEEPRRGRRGMMIAAALVGAIGLGGALAYTYKTFVASSGGRAPLIRAADQGPNKVKPAVQDGKNFADTDKKLLNRLGEDGARARPVGAPPPAAEAADDRTSDDPNAPKRVKIIPIAPPSAGAPPPMTTASAPPRSEVSPMVTVPGVMLDVGPGQGPPPAARPIMPQAQAAPPPRAPVAQAPQPPPVRMAAAPKTDLPIAPAEPPPVKRAAAVPAAPPVAKKEVEKVPVPKTKTAAASAAPASAAPAPTATSGSGFVAVLSSKKSRMDALKAFADMQQKYGDVLATRTPDVQEADLGAEKGTVFRLVVGPPGSREAAAGVCTQLKTAGHKDCWVNRY